MEKKRAPDSSNNNQTIKKGIGLQEKFKIGWDQLRDLRHNWANDKGPVTWCMAITWSKLRFLGETLRSKQVLTIFSILNRYAMYFWCQITFHNKDVIIDVIKLIHSLTRHLKCSRIRQTYHEFKSIINSDLILQHWSPK